MKTLLTEEDPSYRDCAPIYREVRKGDVLHSLADITKAERLLGYVPTHSLLSGLRASLPWYKQFIAILPL